ncbi:MAG: hypothetical protein KC994_25820, partial [Candidatus Omnitrophica bacterium]|nr:hypothetical protein [Candidatus Omnitrophota bacterium]
MKRLHSIKLLLCTVLVLQSTGWSTSIDPGVPLGSYSGMGPLVLPIPYEFRTSDRAWTQEEKDSAIAALEYLGSFFVTQPAFFQQDSPDDFSLRWAGSDIFSDHTTKPGFNNPGWDYSDALAIAVKPRDPNTVPWDEQTYPQNEIYFNTAINWHFDPFTDPNEGDANDDDDGEFDFWTVLIHEAIHMLCVDDHAEHEDEVMYAYLSDGERRWELKESDLDLLR